MSEEMGEGEKNVISRYRPVLPVTIYVFFGLLCARLVTRWAKARRESREDMKDSVPWSSSTLVFSSLSHQKHANRDLAQVCFSSCEKCLLKSL